MKNKADISQLIQNFDNDVDNKRDWLNIHISLMFNELCEINQTIFIFDTVQTEWNKRSISKEKIGYSAIRTILFEALPYKIILGLSKIFVGQQEYSLQKTINIISQMDEFKNRSEIKATIKKVQNYLDTSETIKIVTAYRDQFFAHLDKISVLSDCRIDSTIALNKIDKREICEGINIISELYERCFNQKLHGPTSKLLEKDIIHTFFWM